jgi:hypothetical protein
MASTALWNGCAFVEGRPKTKPVSLSSGSPSRVERDLFGALLLVLVGGDRVAGYPQVLA